MKENTLSPFRLKPPTSAWKFAQNVVLDILLLAGSIWYLKTYTDSQSIQVALLVALIALCDLLATVRQSFERPHLPRRLPEKGRRYLRTETVLLPLIFMPICAAFTVAAAYFWFTSLFAPSGHLSPFLWLVFRILDSLWLAITIFATYRLYLKFRATPVLRFDYGRGKIAVCYRQFFRWQPQTEYDLQTFYAVAALPHRNHTDIVLLSSHPAGHLIAERIHTLRHHSPYRCERSLRQLHRLSGLPVYEYTGCEPLPLIEVPEIPDFLPHTWQPKLLETWFKKQDPP